MKRVIIIFIAFAANIVAGNAQLFVEVDLGVNFEKTYYEYFYDVQNPFSSLSINVSPQVGYWMNDKVVVGARVSFIAGYYKSLMLNLDSQITEFIEWTTGWKGSVFGRYKLCGSEKLSVLAESYLEVGENISKARMESFTWKISSTSLIGIHVVPVITYDLSEKISIKAMCNFLDLGYECTRTKNEYNNKKYTSSRFCFGIPPVTFVNIGCIYNF